MIAALYVATGGAYYGLENVDPWDIHRDARLYDGPWPVVAHPPCARWCRLAELVEAGGGRRVGDDEGCFAAALDAVRRWGGVLEHPSWTKAWPSYGIPSPPSRGWLRAMCGGWVCEVSQAAYGHMAEKLTWLYYVGANPPPPMDWTRPPAAMVVSTSRRVRGHRQEMPKSLRAATPPAFRDLLISIAESARREAA